MALLPHQLRAVARAANALATELEMIPNLYCEECGGELEFVAKTDIKNLVLKECKGCGEEYFVKGDVEQ